MKDYPEELQKAAGSRHQKWKYPKTFPLQQLYRMMLNMSDYGQRQRIKYSESIILIPGQTENGAAAKMKF